MDKPKSGSGAAGAGAQGSATGAKGGERHRWAIDRMEEGTAAVEQDGAKMYEVPRFLVPEGAREGDVLEVTVRQTARAKIASVELTIRVDPAATGSAKSASAAQTQKGTRQANDPGGNISL